MTDKAPTNQQHNPPADSSEQKPVSMPRSAPPLNPLAAASRPLSDAPEIFRAVFDALRGKS